MKITLDLPQSLEGQLARVAERLNISKHTLAEAALRDLLIRSDEDFEAVAARVLEKNADLYRRLA